jgi:hypothetical protein
MALQGLLAVPSSVMMCDQKYEYAKKAREAYLYADALVSALEKVE